MNEAHLAYFKDKALEFEEYEFAIGKIPDAFSYLTNHRLPEYRLFRGDLFSMAADKSIPNDALCISILAWGGAHKNNINNAFACKDEWLPIVDDIRNGNLSRSQAYEAFYWLRQDKKLKGMGAAYYTKLIYFLMPKEVKKPQGYIMDQWVACSVNLLAERNVVLLDTSHRWTASDKRSSTYIVSDANTSDNYEDYCHFIEDMADIIDYSPEEIEYCLMSKGGKIKQPWRDYVIKNRKVF